MKKGLIKAAVLMAVFLITLLISGKVTNKDQLDLTTEMEAPTLPVIVLYNEDRQINELYGYTSQMNATGMRDTITPLSSSREVPLQIRTYGYQIDGISYEIRSIDGERLVSDGNITAFEEKEGQIRTSIPVQSLLEQSREYILTLKLRQDEKICYYYTRIADGRDCYVPESIKFAQQISDLTFSENPDQLSTYWEANAAGDNSTLHKVTIHSTVKQANWADFKCDRLTTPVPSVKEMNQSYNTIVLDYVVTSKGEQGELEYYNVEEYYRIRYTNERMYLLNFERTMNQIFNGENDFLYENYLQLGIRSKEVEYMQNESQTVTCFVQEGDLWSYNQSFHRLAEVFSFRGHEGIEARENHMQHDIRILNVDEAGDIDYVVYGYMNRGIHEGEMGISFLHYASQANTNEEKLFLSFENSYQVLQAELGKLLYENTSGSIYLLFNGTVFYINPATMEMEEIASGLSDDTYAVSESNRYFAWISDHDAREISVIDLETANISQIRAKEGKSLRVLGFLQEDLVYGMAADKHQTGGMAGIRQAPMYALRIVNASNMEVLKKYRKKGYFIDSVEFQNGVLIMQRLSQGPSGYEQAQQDSIVNRTQESEDQKVIHTTVTEVRQTQVQLTLSEMKKETPPVFIAAKQILNQEDKKTALKPSQEQRMYFAYAAGSIKAATTDVAEAIRSADEHMGVVVDEKQNYIWKRARKNIQPYLEAQPSDTDASGSSLAKCVSAILRHEGIEVSASELLEKGDTPQEILESLLPEREVIGIEGCSLSQILYYVNRETPVLAAAGAQKTMLVTGYDALNVWLYDPLAGSIVKSTIEDADGQFRAAGGIYLVYQ
ncbi:MAG: hypothetical protein HFH34_01590 [Eubacterium sp.]|nr:hypothetical protein [Eubacterium sp.]